MGTAAGETKHWVVQYTHRYTMTVPSVLVESMEQWLRAMHVVKCSGEVFTVATLSVVVHGR